MVRAVDPRRTRKALRRVRQLEISAAAGTLSDWEKTFLQEVGARLEEYGSAFADYAKGAPDEALSRLQGAKLREISSKTRKDDKAAEENLAPAADAPPAPTQPRKPNGFARRTPMRAKRPPRPADGA